MINAPSKDVVGHAVDALQLVKDLNKVSKKKRFSTKPTVTVELNPLTERK